MVGKSTATTKPQSLSLAYALKIIGEDLPVPDHDTSRGKAHKVARNIAQAVNAEKASQRERAKELLDNE